MSKEMENKIEELESRIIGLEIDIDDLLSRLEAVKSSSKNMRDIMEEVAKLANQPVGVLFDYRA
jgi:archaellum component FlaC